MTIVRYGWFGLLVLIAFGYLAAGFSDRSTKTHLDPVAKTNFSGNEAEDKKNEAEDKKNAASDSGLPLAEITAANPQTLDPASRFESATKRDDGLRDSMAAIESSLVRDWDDAGIRRAEDADWLTICRRMSLALVGSGLSLEEIRRLEAMPESRREHAHLESLLVDPRFHQYWAERWSRFY
ncbi:putative secreted protein, partial [Rhodopirellula maiorica SM1]